MQISLSAPNAPEDMGGTYRSHVYRTGAQERVTGGRGLAEGTRRSRDGGQVD